MPVTSWSEFKVRWKARARRGAIVRSEATIYRHHSGAAQPATTPAQAPARFLFYSCYPHSRAQRPVQVVPRRVQGLEASPPFRHSHRPPELGRDMAKPAGKVVVAFQRVLDEHEAALKRLEKDGKSAEEVESFRRTQVRPAYLHALSVDAPSAARGKVVKSLWEAHMYKPLAGIRKEVQVVRHAVASAAGAAARVARWKAFSSVCHTPWSARVTARATVSPAHPHSQLRPLVPIPPTRRPPRLEIRRSTRSALRDFTPACASIPASSSRASRRSHGRWPQRPRRRQRQRAQRRARRAVRPHPRRRRHHRGLRPTLSLCAAPSSTALSTLATCSGTRPSSLRTTAQAMPHPRRPLLLRLLRLHRLPRRRLPLLLHPHPRPPRHLAVLFPLLRRPPPLPSPPRQPTGRPRRAATYERRWPARAAGTRTTSSALVPRRLGATRCRRTASSARCLVPSPSPAWAGSLSPSSRRTTAF